MSLQMKGKRSHKGQRVLAEGRMFLQKDRVFLNSDSVFSQGQCLPAEGECFCSRIVFVFCRGPVLQWCLDKVFLPW